MNLTVLHVPALEDNYIWIASSGQKLAGKNRVSCVVVDPGDAEAAAQALDRELLIPEAILCTHRHFDHVGGVEELASRFDIPVYGPKHENIKEVTHPVDGGMTIDIQGVGGFKVFDTFGHTTGHISYISGDALFCGDTLFSAGCGRLFDGTAAQLFKSLKLISSLPANTKIYCTHEYTLANLRFASAVDPNNPEIPAYTKRCNEKRQLGKPTLPSSVSQELLINPFLRTDNEAIQQSVEQFVGHKLHSEAEVFTELRKWKDQFTG